MILCQELRGRLIRHEQGSLYGATNAAFLEDAEDEKESTIYSTITNNVLPIGDPEIVEAKQPEDERESWDSKVMFLLATIGYD